MNVSIGTPGADRHRREGGEPATMNGGDGSPVMTESERRAYRYAQAAAAAAAAARQQQQQQQGMRKSWSNDSLAGYAAYGGGGGGGRGRASCVCAPTTHPGSFRCKHHRHAHASNLAADADADAKQHHGAAGEAPPATDQEKSAA
ncbi:hypothetical protein ACP4OV_005108 [Aristida adscensionis]